MPATDETAAPESPRTVQEALRAIIEALKSDLADGSLSPETLQVKLDDILGGIAAAIAGGETDFDWDTPEVMELVEMTPPDGKYRDTVAKHLAIIKALSDIGEQLEKYNARMQECAAAVLGKRAPAENLTVHPLVAKGLKARADRIARDAARATLAKSLRVRQTETDLSDLRSPMPLWKRIDGNWQPTY